MIKYIFFCIVIAGITSCNDSDKKAPENQANASESKFGKQLKISVLWDLSDRINPKIHTDLPTNADRDIAIIKYFADYLKADMDKKGAFMAKGKLKVFFSPNPTDQNINSLASRLDIDLSNKDVKLKKEVYDNISNSFEQSAKQITDMTIKTSKWVGSDIYRFFKNDVVDYCVSKDTSYRNILVILTDGYIYHPQSKGRAGNKSEYILSDLLSSLGLRNNQNFKSVFQSKNCGLISTRKDLNNLEILVLEVNSEANYKNDEDIIKFYLQNWFTEMNAKRFEIYNTDLPENTKKRIGDFLNYK
ncbi:MAG: hypothetical protein IM550_06840 [Microcystis sp. M54BS1]|nr:hypothetical protein [Microcystis sp. M54BS1]MCA6440987.1 hypothetical protein [Chitinophagaceae bacterium]MCA6455526.1 hypothetical protein [Chitinophagaceae bacterium]